MITLATKLAIGFKFEVTTVNGFKLVGNRNRQFLVTLENDLYNVYAFTLKGINMVNEKKVNGIFADQLNKTITELA
jgi:hypothetical protein